MPAYFEISDVQRAADGDHTAFERLYREHVGRVYALCLRMVDEQYSEDLTQEVLVSAWTELSTFKGQVRFGTWLDRLAVNHVFSLRVTQRKREARHVGGQGLLALGTIGDGRGETEIDTGSGTVRLVR